MHTAFVDKIRKHRVGDTYAVSDAWMNGHEPGDADLRVPVSLTQEMIFAHTLTEVSAGVTASGCLGESLGVVRIRDEARDPGGSVLLIDQLSKALGAVRYTYVTAHHPGFDLYTATIFFAPR